MVLPRVRRTRPAPAYPDPSDRPPPHSLAPPLEFELNRPCYLASSAVARFTLIRSCALRAGFPQRLSPSIAPTPLRHNRLRLTDHLGPPEESRRLLWSTVQEPSAAYAEFQ